MNFEDVAKDALRGYLDDDEAAEALASSNPYIQQEIAVQGAGDAVNAALAACGTWQDQIWTNLAFFGKAFLIVAVLGAILKSGWVREFLSPMYASGSISVGIVEDYRAKWKTNGKPTLSLNAAVFLGLTTIGFLHFAGSIFGALIDLFGTILQTAPIC